MATVLRNVGLRVTEHLVQKQKRRAGSRAAFAVLLPGLARGCSNDAYMNTVLRTCSSGAADMTLLLQFGNIHRPLPLRQSRPRRGHIVQGIQRRIVHALRHGLLRLLQHGAHSSNTLRLESRHFFTYTLENSCHIP